MSAPTDPSWPVAAADRANVRESLFAAPSTDFSNKVCRKRIWWTVIKRFLRASAIADVGSKSLG